MRIREVDVALFAVIDFPYDIEKMRNWKDGSMICVPVAWFRQELFPQFLPILFLVLHPHPKAIVPLCCFHLFFAIQTGAVTFYHSVDKISRMMYRMLLKFLNGYYLVRDYGNVIAISVLEITNYFHWENEVLQTIASSIQRYASKISPWILVTPCITPRCGNAAGNGIVDLVKFCDAESRLRSAERNNCGPPVETSIDADASNHTEIY